MPLIRNASAALTVITLYLTLSAYASGNKHIGPPSPVCDVNDLMTLSCTPEANITNSCCVENPGGLLLQTQIYSPDIGPADSWTIHGLWGDFCNGSYPAACDTSRDYKDIAGILQSYGEGVLVDYMSEIWLNYPPVTTVDGSAADLWAHEWAKHGTCMSTLLPQCYSNYSTGQELVDFFKTTTRLFRSLPTFDFLKTCGIIPSNQTTYALADIENCLTKAAMSSVPYIGCSKDGSLEEVWYYFHWMGRIRDGLVVGVNNSLATKCPSKGIKYPPKY